MGNHFIVLQLPGSRGLRLTEGAKSPAKFWAKAVTLIKNGKAKLICRRCDTGVSEELRGHIRKLERFTTYLLLDMELNQDELQNQKAIFEKAVIQLSDASQELVIDNDEKFQLIAIGA